MNLKSTRRSFLRRNISRLLSLTIAPVIVPSAVLGREGQVAPSNRIGVGCIGVGPQGRSDMGGFLNSSDARVLALCDVAKRNLDLALKQVNQKYEDQACLTFRDFHELLDRPDIDAVLIATPDHWHVPIALAAVQAGKDIYLEKPIGLSIEEDQLLRRAVHQGKRVFQFGTQQRSSKEFRQACELVRNGRIGRLRKINVWCSASRPGGSTQEAIVPADFDYDRWLGPAPYSPFTEDKCFDVSSPGAWKTWWFNYDYALGFIAGWGVHPLDIANWGHPAMMQGPMTVQGEVLLPTEGACNTGIAWDVMFTFADGVQMEYRGTRNGFEVKNELNDMEPWQAKFGPIPDHGTAFEGTEGWVVVYRGGLRTSPSQIVEEPLSQTGVRLPVSSNHVRNFLDAVRSRAETICPIDEAVQADILCHLSDIASRLNRKLTWDPRTERFLQDDDANHKLAKRTARNRNRT